LAGSLRKGPKRRRPFDDHPGSDLLTVIDQWIAVVHFTALSLEGARLGFFYRIRCQCPYGNIASAVDLIEGSERDAMSSPNRAFYGPVFIQARILPDLP
jgi:hypothetical protein